MSGLNNIGGLLRDAHAKRKGLTDLSGCAYAAVTAASVEIVSAAANVKGIRVAVVCFRLHAAASFGTGSLLVSGEYLMGSSVRTSEGGIYVERDIFVPAGESLTVASGDGTTIYIAYEVLS